MAHALGLATTGAAQILGLGCPEIAVGATADLVALPAAAAAEAVAGRRRGG